MPQRAYSYARISTGDQAGGDGLRRQQGTEGDDRESWPVTVCREQGWILDDTLKFTDSGRSGFHQANLKPTADLSRFLNLVQRGRITAGSVLVIEQIDRLSRAAVDEAYDLFRGILKAGVWICTKTPFRIYRPGSDSSFMDIMEPLWIMYVAWMESLKKSERAAAAWETARKRAKESKTPLPGRCPFWLTQTASGHEIKPLEAATALRIHELCQQGKGVCLILQALEREGWAPPGKKPWCESTIQWVLATRATLGEYQPCQRPGGKLTPVGEPIRDYYPLLPGMSEAMWQRSQAVIASHKGKRGRTGKQTCNVFLGIAHDATSRKRLVIRSKGRGPGKVERKYPYLTSHNVGGLRVPYEPFEQATLKALAMIRPCDVVDDPRQAGEREETIKELTAELTKLEEHRQSLKKRAADPAKATADLLDILETVGEQCKDKAKVLEAMKLESLTGRTESLGECQQLADMVLKAEGEEKRELQERIRSVLPGVVASIWVQAQKVSERTQITHVQIWLHSGKCRYFQLVPENLKGVSPWQLEGWDMRRGPYSLASDVSHAAEMAASA